MSTEHSTESLSALGIAVLAALGFGAAALVFTLPRGGTVASEGVFLTVFLVSTLLATAPSAVFEPRRRTVIVLWSVSALVGTLAIWTLSAGLVRSAVIGALLSLLAAISIVSTREQGLEVRRWLPAGLALQLVFRSELLVNARDGVAIAVELIGLPLLGVFLALHLARRWGGLVVGSMVIAVLTVSGGWTGAGLAALAAPPVVALVFDAGARRLWRFAGVLAVALGLVWSAPMVVVALLGGLALVRRRGWPAALLVSAGILLWIGPGSSWSDAFVGVAGLLILAPWSFGATRLASPLADGDGPVREEGGRAWGIVAALSLALVASRTLAPQEALAAPVVVLLLSRARELGRSALRVDDVAAVVWSGLLLTLVAARAAPPWLRDDAFVGLLLELGWTRVTGVVGLGLGVVATVIALSVLSPAANRRGGADGRLAQPSPTARGWSPAVFLLVLCAPWLWRAANTRTLLAWPPQTLSAAAPSWETAVAVSARGTRTVGTGLVLDTALTNSAELGAGTGVATVEIAEHGEVLFAQELHYGTETAEWAAARPGLEHLPAPAAHLSLVSAEGDYFARRYRTVLCLPRLDPAPDGGEEIEISVRRSPDLPADVEIHLFYGALAPGRADCRESR